MLKRFHFLAQPATLLACLLVPVSAAFVGCDANDGPMEEAGEQADEAAENIQDETEDAAENVQDETEDAADEIQDEADDATDE